MLYYVQFCIKESKHIYRIFIQLFRSDCAYTLIFRSWHTFPNNIRKINFQRVHSKLQAYCSFATYVDCTAFLELYPSHQTYFIRDNIILMYIQLTRCSLVTSSVIIALGASNMLSLLHQVENVHAYTFCDNEIGIFVALSHPFYISY